MSTYGEIESRLAERLRLMPDEYIGSGGPGYYHEFAASIVLESLGYQALLDVAGAAQRAVTHWEGACDDHPDYERWDFTVEAISDLRAALAQLNPQEGPR